MQRPHYNGLYRAIIRRPKPRTQAERRAEIHDWELSIRRWERATPAWRARIEMLEDILTDDADRLEMKLMRLHQRLTTEFSFWQHCAFLVRIARRMDAKKCVEVLNRLHDIS